MPLPKERHAEPIPGYRLLEPLGRGAFGEVWKCEAPGGLYKAIKFVYGNLKGVGLDSVQAEEELRAIQRIKSIRHPFLLSMDRVENVEGELLIVSELADQSLHDLLEERRRAGRPGIDRDQLLAYLREAAEVLDLLNREFELQHLDVKPRNLFLVSNHVKVADFGLVNSLAGGAVPSQLGGITPLYASPEVFLGKISPHSDQYSLAIVYQELLTGTLPFGGKNSRQLLLGHTKGQPDLKAVPETDRAVLTRALAKDPQQRYPTCLDLVRALAGTPSAASILLPGGPTAAADTAPLIPRMSDTQPMRARRGKLTPPVVPGFRPLENIGSSLLSEVWRAENGDGKQHLLKVIYGFAPASGRGIDEALLRLKALCHPALPRLQVVKREPGKLILSVQFFARTLRDRLTECQAEQLPGVPRAELLNHLRAAAEALDYFAQQQGVYHLGLNPRTLLVERHRLQLADFGLAHLLWAPAGQSVAQRNYSYSAPELFDKQPNAGCDQYSLALIYHEMLTGVPVPPVELRPARGQARPDLARLPAGDRDLIARALDPDPNQRWPSCSDFVQALQAAGGSRAAPAEPDRFAAIVTAGATPRQEEAPVGSMAALHEVLCELIRSAGGTPDTEVHLGKLTETADGGVEYRFRAGLPVGLARQKLAEFRQQCAGQPVRDEEECFAFRVLAPGRSWRRLVGLQPALLVQVLLTRPHALSATPIDVTARLRPLRCGKKRGTQLLDEMSGNLIDGLRARLLVNAEKRTQDRLLWPHPLRVCPVDGSGREGPPIECRGKDISLSGMGFYLPHELDTSEVCIKLPTPLHPPALSIPATLVRAKRCADGWYEVGALFRLASMRHAQHVNGRD
jgi:serine/threonine protein kinase